MHLLCYFFFLSHFISLCICSHCIPSAVVGLFFLRIEQNRTKLILYLLEDGISLHFSSNDRWEVRTTHWTGYHDYHLQYSSDRCSQ